VNREPHNPLCIDYLSNINLDGTIIDELYEFNELMPDAFDEMMFAGAVPSSHADRAKCYPKLFPSENAARLAFRSYNKGGSNLYKDYIYRETTPLFHNSDLTPAERASLGNPMIDAVVSYRVDGQRGADKTLQYRAADIDPLAWLQANLSPHAILTSEARTIDGTQPPEGATEQDEVIDMVDHAANAMLHYHTVRKEIGVSRLKLGRLMKSKKSRHLNRFGTDKKALICLLDIVGPERFREVTDQLVAEAAVRPAACRPGYVSV